MNRSGNLSKLVDAVKEWYVYSRNYRQLGLVSEDLFPEEDKNVSEALRRLTPQEYDQRAWRIRRALDCSLKKSILPENQWTKPENDLPYISKYIKVIKKEKADELYWNTL